MASRVTFLWAFSLCNNGLYLQGIVVKLLSLLVSFVWHEPGLQQVLVETVPQASNRDVICNTVKTAVCVKNTSVSTIVCFKQKNKINGAHIHIHKVREIYRDTHLSADFYTMVINVGIELCKFQKANLECFIHKTCQKSSSSNQRTLLKAKSILKDILLQRYT